MKINIQIDMPKTVKPEYKQPSIIEKCHEYMKMCESDYESAYHFQYLTAVYKKLSQKKHLPDDLANLEEVLKEFISKYDVDQSILEGDKLYHRHKG